MRNSGEWGNSSMAGMGSGRRPACRRFWTSPRVVARTEAFHSWASRRCERGFFALSRLATSISRCGCGRVHAAVRSSVSQRPIAAEGDAGWFSEKVVSRELERNPCPNPSALMSVW